MSISKEAFFHELEKIAEDERAPVTPNRLRAALTAGLAASGGFGLGWGAGNLVADLLPPIRRFVPNPTPGQLQKGMLLAGALTTGGQLALSEMKRRAMEHVAKADEQPQDMLMGHEELNPNALTGESDPPPQDFGPPTRDKSAAFIKRALSTELMQRANAMRHAARNTAFEGSFLGDTRRAYEVAQKKLLRNQSLMDARMSLRGMLHAHNPLIQGASQTATSPKKNLLRNAVVGTAALGATGAGVAAARGDRQEDTAMPLSYTNPVYA